MTAWSILPFKLSVQTKCSGGAKQSGATLASFSLPEDKIHFRIGTAQKIVLYLKKNVSKNGETS